MQEDNRFIHFRYNAFDIKQFNDLLNNSLILKHYEQVGKSHFHDFHELMFMIFLLSYKIVLTESTSKRQSVNAVLVQYLQNRPEIQRIRLRTAGSKRLTYIAMKRLLDLILEKSRGSHWLTDLTQILESTGDQNHPNENLNTTDTLDQVMRDSSGLENTPSTFETWLLLLKPEVIDQILNPEEMHALDHLLHLFAENPTLGKSLIEEMPTPLSEINTFTKDLLSELMRHEALEKYAALHNVIQETLKEPLKDKAHSPITEWVDTLSEKLKTQLESDESKDMDGHTESDENMNSEKRFEEEKRFEDHSNETLEDTLKKTFEKRFAPILNKQLLTANSRAPKESSPTFLSDLEQESTDSQVMISGSNGRTPLTQVIGFQKNAHSQNARAPLRTSNEPYWEISALLNNLKFSNGLSGILEEIDQFDDRIKALGIDHSSVDQMAYDEVINLYKRIKTPTFIKFINQVGRQKIEAHKIQASKLKQKTIPIDKIGFSNNIDLLISDEFINLSLDVAAFENDFYDRYLNDALLTIKMVGKSTKHKGPIILCYDGSGSMEGVKIEETRMHILSIIEIAKIQKRALKLIQFASASEPLYLKELNPLRISAQDILDILDTFICGGTDFEKPLAKAVEFILKEPHKNSDILFITDGQCEIKSKFKAQFLTLKQKHQFKLYTIIMHAYTYHDYGDIGDISDAILEANERHWNAETNRKLYALL